ncbi:MAG: diacylglycerol kinase family protein [Patulibacter sp.]
MTPARPPAPGSNADDRAAAGSMPRVRVEREAPRSDQAMLIVNPIATTVSKGATAEIAATLRKRYAVDVRVTDARGHATQLAQEAVDRGVGLVAVYAGDGTTNEAIQALAGSETALAHLPGGSSSVLARILGMGGSGPAAARRVVAPQQRARRIDLGDVNGRPFSFSAGIGLDAAVVKLVDGDLQRKQRLRWTAFWLEAVRTARHEYFGAAPSMTVASGGEEVRAVSAIVQNAEAYTYAGPRPLTVGRDVSLESHTLQATAVTDGLRWVDVPSLTYRTLSAADADRHPRLHTLPASAELTVTCDRPMPIQLDGDYWTDMTEARFTVRPRALTVIS